MMVALEQGAVAGRVETRRYWSTLAPMAGFLLFLIIIPFRDIIDPLLTSWGALRLGPSGRAIIIFLVPVLLSTAILIVQHRGFRGAFEELGLTGSAKTGFLFGFLATLPALIGFALTVKRSVTDLSLNDVLYKVAGLARSAKRSCSARSLLGCSIVGPGWASGPAAILPSGAVRRSCISTLTLLPARCLVVFAVTGLGGLLFSYVFVRFGWNLWAPIALHVFLNLWWGVFDVSHNALGGWSDNVFRAASLALAFIIMIAAKRNASWSWLAPTQTGWHKA